MDFDVILALGWASTEKKKDFQNEEYKKIIKKKEKRGEITNKFYILIIFNIRITQSLNKRVLNTSLIRNWKERFQDIHQMK